MKLLTLIFDSGFEYLAHYSNADLQAVFYRSKTELEEGEEVIMDIRFPELVEPAIVRGSVISMARDGAWIRFDEPAARDHLVEVACGHVSKKDQRPRAYTRFPVDMPGICRMDFQEEPVEVETVDLGAGGAFVRAETSDLPDVGSRVRLILGPTEDTKETFVMHAKVAWHGSESGKPAFGVQWRSHDDNTRRLRTMLRKGSEAGEIHYAN
jgi:hypothetical protein